MCNKAIFISTQMLLRVVMVDKLVAGFGFDFCYRSLANAIS